MNYFRAKLSPLFPFIYLFLFLVLATNVFSQARKTTNFDSGWQFIKGDVPGAEKPLFNDAQWTKLDVPNN